MRNKVTIDTPIVSKNRITFSYSVEGEWANVFHPDEFFVEYSIDISSIPESIAIIPILANILPMSWVFDAEIIIKSVDRDFYESIPDFKRGYQEMYPMLNLAGKLSASEIITNNINDQSGAAAFFSGGVDAFGTLISHIDEKPTLLTIWGADVKLNDISGWSKVESHITETGREFDLDHVMIKTSFRNYFDEWKMSQKVLKSGDGWWHGFQHGLGMIAHAAPVMYTLKKKTIYFASSFTIADKGKVTCASDPTIDNFIHFCGVDVIHDGYEYDRQDKVHNITQYSKKSGRKIPLRVCWESTGGSNCCACEKCWRTILAIYAEGFDPKDFGFRYKDFSKLALRIHMEQDKLRSRRETMYKPIQNVMRKNYTQKSVNKNLRWFYDTNIHVLGNMSIPQRIIRKIYRLLTNTK